MNKRDGGADRYRGSAKEAGLPEIHTQMRIANRLAVAQLKSKMGQQELVRLLAGTGASHAEIADVLDTTVGTVAVTLQRLRKKANSSSGLENDRAVTSESSKEER